MTKAEIKARKSFPRIDKKIAKIKQKINKLNIKLGEPKNEN